VLKVLQVVIMLPLNGGLPLEVAVELKKRLLVKVMVEVEFVLIL
tara:strand:- start:157 stop:288 length:132 start_codon:yes stop_codon:yes gene_type:complete